MKKLSVLIMAFVLFGTLGLKAQGSNLQSSHNYKRPASKSIQKSPQVSYVSVSSSSNFANNNINNYKLPHYIKPVSTNLIPIEIASGIGASHVNYKQPYLASNLIRQNTKNDSIALRKRNLKPDVQNDSI